MTDFLLSSTDRTLVGNQNMLARLRFFKSVPLFADLTTTELSALARDFIRREFQEGESIFQQGDPGEVLYLIESGQVRIFVQGRDGQELSVIIHGSGDMFGEMALVDNLPRSASAVVAEAAVVYALTRDRLREHMRTSFQLSLNFMRALSLRLRYSSELMGNLALLDVPSRLARKLLDLAQTHGQPEGDGLKIDQVLKQSELAAMLGTTRESINKALGHFKRLNLIKVEQGYYTLLNSDALREISW